MKNSKKLNDSNSSPPFPEIPVVQYLNLCSYFGIVPYKFKWDSMGNEYVIQTSYWWKFLGFFIHIIAPIESSTSMLKLYFSDGSDGVVNVTPSSTISLTLYFVGIMWGTLVYINFTQIIYWKKQDMLDLINSELFRYGCGVEGAPNWRAKLQVPILFVTTISASIVHCAYRHSNPALIYVASKVFPSPIYESTWMKFVSVIVEFLEIFEFAIHCGLLVSFMLTLRMGSGLYRRQCQQGLDSNLDGIMDAREAQREVTSRVNSIIGMGIVHYIVAVTYFVTLPVLKEQELRDLSQQLWIGYYLIMSGLFWILGSEHHLQLKETTKEWLRRQVVGKSGKSSQGQETMSTSSLDMKLALVAFQNESDNNPIGISCRFFTVTYGFIASMLGIICTYATIMYQIHPV